MFYSEFQPERARIWPEFGRFSIDFVRFFDQKKNQYTRTPPRGNHFSGQNVFCFIYWDTGAIGLKLYQPLKIDGTFCLGVIPISGLKFSKVHFRRYEISKITKKTPFFDQK